MLMLQCHILTANLVMLLLMMMMMMMVSEYIIIYHLQPPGMFINMYLNVTYPEGLKDHGVQRTKQKSWPLYRGIEPQLDALEVVFDFMYAVVKSHYKSLVWNRPSRATLKEALETLLPH